MTDEPAALDHRCYRHPDREAYIACQRCGRSICPDCMRDAAVGFQCPSCVQEGAKSVRAPTTLAGGAVPVREGIASMVLIGINVAAFVLTLLLGGTSGRLTQLGAMITSSGLFRDGSDLVAVTGVADGAYWRMLTSAFLHSGALHLLFNMYALYLFGPMIERVLGVRRFVAVYVTMAVGASVFIYWLASPNSFTVGASGAVFGLFALALVLLLKAGQDVRFLLIMLALNAVISLQGNISWQGHLGGFLTGLVIGVAIAYAPRERRQLVQIVVFAVIWIAIIVATAVRTLSLT